jgi:hypothetical protein
VRAALARSPSCREIQAAHRVYCNASSVYTNRGNDANAICIIHARSPHHRLGAARTASAGDACHALKFVPSSQVWITRCARIITCPFSCRTARAGTANTAFWIDVVGCCSDACGLGGFPGGGIGRVSSWPQAASRHVISVTAVNAGERDGRRFLYLFIAHLRFRVDRCFRQWLYPDGMQSACP